MIPSRVKSGKIKAVKACLACLCLTAVLIAASGCSRLVYKNETSEALSGTEESGGAASIDEASKLPEQRAYTGPLLEEGEKHEKEYLDNAVFVGDSVTHGLVLYDFVKKDNIISSTGINPGSILTAKEFTDLSGNKVTCREAVKDRNPEKVYILIGTNGIAWLTSEYIVGNYGLLIDQILEDNPAAEIVLQSIPPVSKKQETDNARMANDKIDRYNEAIIELALEKEVYYLDFASVLKDENGCFKNGLHAGDGIHFLTASYQMWFDYLLSHPLPQE